MFDFEVKGNLVEATLENGKVYKISTKWVEETCEKLDIDDYDAIEMWLSDKGYLDNEEQEELDSQAKGVVKNIAKAETPKKKTQKERVAKDNPDKEYIVGCIAEYLEELQATNVNITNKTKLIEFTYKSKEFKLDLVEKRKKKAE